MARTQLKAMSPSRTVRVLEGSLRARFNMLSENGGYSVEWRRLQFDAVQGVVESQRILVALHSEILAVLRSDRELYRRLRLESLELAMAVDAIRELIRDIERAMVQVEYPN